MGRIYQIVAAKPGMAAKNVQEAVQESLKRGERVIQVPNTAIILTLAGGRVQLDPEGGAQ